MTNRVAIEKNSEAAKFRLITPSSISNSDPYSTADSPHYEITAHISHDHSRALSLSHRWEYSPIAADGFISTTGIAIHTFFSLSFRLRIDITWNDRWTFNEITCAKQGNLYFILQRSRTQTIAFCCHWLIKSLYQHLKKSDLPGTMNSIQSNPSGSSFSASRKYNEMSNSASTLLMPSSFLFSFSSDLLDRLIKQQIRREAKGKSKENWVIHQRHIDPFVPFWCTDRCARLHRLLRGKKRCLMSRETRKETDFQSVSELLPIDIILVLSLIASKKKSLSFPSAPRMMCFIELERSRKEQSLFLLINGGH